MFSRFWHDRSGATAVEYGVIVTILSMAVVGGIGFFYESLQQLFTDTDNQLNQALN